MGTPERDGYRASASRPILGSMTTAALERPERPAPALSRTANLGPNWFASVMGTGIVANAAVTLPAQLPGLRGAAAVVWVAAATLLVGLTVAWAGHWTRHRAAARGHARNPVMAQFYGAPPMALLTVGAGAVLLGPDLIGEPAALAIGWTLWLLGTLAGLASAVAIPYLMFTRFDLRTDSTFGGWLMPVVPPMVSAATGALLVPSAAAGQGRLTLVLACYAMFGLSLLASVIITTLIWQRLALHKPGPAATVPTLWIVLGWLGQSITAANLLGGVAHLALPDPYATALAALGVVYGVPVFGFALLWVALAAAVTIRTARQHLPFALTWWSFTFPVGTVVTGTSALALHTGSDVLAGLAVLFYVGLVAAWVTVAVRTARGALSGALFAPAISPFRTPISPY